MSTVELRRGASRFVVLVGRIAIKLPCIKRKSVLSLWGQVRQGRNCNRAERAAWIARKFPHLCPILWADRFGWIVVMKRAQPMTCVEFDAWFLSGDWPHIPFEPAPYELTAADAGRLPCGRRVMIDYGMRGYQVDLPG